MDNLFDYAEACLYSPEIEQKLALTHEAADLWMQGRLSLGEGCPVLPIGGVQFPGRPVLRQPKDMPRRNPATPDGAAAFFHAIAHVEFSAIYLAWDIVYRFRGLPEAFYGDWLKVADEEVQHFELLCKHLKNLGFDYGDLPAHSGLWEHAVDTSGDLLARLAMVPRCMEARGLDVTPGLIEKFEQLGDDQGVALLTRILTDEVGHVERGSYWFKQVCAQQNREPEAAYRQLIGQYYKGGKPKGPFNREMRIIAGFSNAELDWLETD